MIAKIINKHFLLSVPLNISKFQVKPLEVTKEDFQDGLLGQLVKPPQTGELQKREARQKSKIKGRLLAPSEPNPPGLQVSHTFIPQCILYHSYPEEPENHLSLPIQKCSSQVVSGPATMCLNFQKREVYLKGFCG